MMRGLLWLKQRVPDKDEPADAEAPRPSGIGWGQKYLMDSRPIEAHVDELLTDDDHDRPRLNLYNDIVYGPAGYLKDPMSIWDQRPLGVLDNRSWFQKDLDAWALVPGMLERGLEAAPEAIEHGLDVVGESASSFAAHPLDSTWEATKSVGRGVGHIVESIDREVEHLMGLSALYSEMPDGHPLREEVGRQMSEQSFWVALNAFGGGGGAAAKPRALSSFKPVAAPTLASRSARLYDPPDASPRSFSKDYPNGAQADETGKLEFDIDGNPLTAEYIFGRGMVGGKDEALSPAEYDAISKGLIGSVHQSVAARALPRNSVGAYRKVAGPDGPVRSIGVLKSLTPQQAAWVTAHELSHAIDELAGEIPTKGLNVELRRLYNTLNTGEVRTRHLTGPEGLGYRGEDIPRELIAEAIRAYMIDPNYVKTFARKTAKAIRKAVNANPRLNKTIQFNSFASPFGVGGLAEGGEPVKWAVIPDGRARASPTGSAKPPHGCRGDRYQRVFRCWWDVRQGNRKTSSLSQSRWRFA